MVKVKQVPLQETEAPTLYDLVHDPSLETYGAERKAQLLPKTRLMRFGGRVPMSYDIGFSCDDAKTIARNSGVNVFLIFVQKHFFYIDV